MIKGIKEKYFKRVGPDEIFAFWYECPDCKNHRVHTDANYCDYCGVKIIKENENE